jgi:hypothetical protein
MRHDHRRRAGAQRQGCKLGAELLCTHVWIQQSPDGGLGDRSAGFAIDDQRMADFAALDHARRDVHAVEKGQAGIADVEVHTVLTQAQVAVHDAGRGWLQVIATHRGVDDDADVLPVHAGFPDGFLRCQGGGIGRLHTGFPHPSRTDAREFFQQVGANAKAFGGRPQAFADFFRGDDNGWLDRRERSDYDILEQHGPGGLGRGR